MDESLSRKRVLRRIADASLFGQLGLFVGTGFSMALTNQKALRFEGLLREVSERLDLEFDFDDPDELRGRGYPGIATRLVDLLEPRMSSRKAAERRLKREIARICNLTCDESRRKEFEPVVTGLKPAWVITTNYDFILEQLLEKPVSLLPDEVVITRRDYVPVYHLHGHRLLPKSIVVTDEDYVAVLGNPLEYRQRKLSLLFTESTTLMLGYSVGDLNVRAAMNLARSHSKRRDLRRQDYEGCVIQVHYEPDNPKSKPCLGRNGEIIIETSDLLAFLQEVLDARVSRRKRFRSARKTIADVLDDPAGPRKLVEDATTRQKFIRALSAFPHSYQASHVVGCMRKALEPVWESARERDGWEYYDVFLKFILDVLERIEVDRLHPTFSEYLAESFARMARYLEPDGQMSLRKPGKAWDAIKTWRARRDDLLPSAIKMLKRYARDNDDDSMRLILKDLKL